MSPLKLTLLLLIIKDSKPSNLIEEISYYTSSSSIQVNAILNELKRKKFIGFVEGNFILTNASFNYLRYRGYENANIEKILDVDSKINESHLISYIPNK